MESVTAVEPPLKKRRQRMSIDSFDEALGELSPIPIFKGPRLPSNRQVLRRFLFEFKKPGTSKLTAAKTTVSEVLALHVNVPGHKKEAKHLVPMPIRAPGKTDFWKSSSVV